MAHRNARLTPIARLELVREVDAGWTQAEVTRRFRVSRHSVAKWLGRSREEGAAGLADRSSAPRRHPRCTPPDLERRSCAVRRTQGLRAAQRLCSPLGYLSPVEYEARTVQKAKTGRAA